MTINRQTIIKSINDNISAAPQRTPGFEKLSPTKLLPQIAEQEQTIAQAFEKLKEAQQQLSTYHGQKFFLFRAIIRFCDNHFGIGSKLKKTMLTTQKIAASLQVNKSQVQTIVDRIKQNREEEIKLRAQFNTIQAELNSESAKGKSKEIELEKAKKPFIPGITTPNAEKVAKLTAELSTSTQAQKEKYSELLKIKTQVETLRAARKQDLDPIQI